MANFPFSEDGKETIWRRDFYQPVFADLVLVTIVGRAGPKGRSCHHLARPVLLPLTSMVLIGIQPFATRKILILVVALLCLSSAICFADSLFMSLHSRPYGRRPNRIKPILPSVSEFTVQPPSLVAYQSLDGRFTQDAGWILRKACVLPPAIN